jgi:hypothetical protein
VNRAAIDRIANAVFYEGYVLYPYRPSVKNRQRWTFGGICPEAYCLAGGGEAWNNQTECLVQGGPETALGATVRFLHLTARQVGEFVPPLAEWPGGAVPPFRPVESLRVGDRLYHTWQEAEERAVALDECTLGELAALPRGRPFAFPGGRRPEPVGGEGGAVAGVLVREQQAIEGAIEIRASPVEEELYRVTLRVINRTPMANAATAREEALLHSLVSTHAILGVREGAFVSLTDPPACWRGAAEACRNVGTWPVLVGAPGQKDTLLASAIILPDYPEVAAESPGDFFDGTEIDEMLTLRIMTLTEEEKREMAAVDDRTGDLLRRTEALAREQLRGLHGTLRGLRPC